MTIRWSRNARDDLFEILNHIAENDASIALTIIERIEEAVGYLASHPSLGRPGRVRDTRELIMSDLPYVIPYRIVGETVEIIRVLHAARKWPDTT